jgi:Fic family protein
MIHCTPTIDSTLKAKLAELDDLRTSLGREVAQPRPWNGLLRREAAIDAVTSSTSIEGFRTDASTASALVSGEASPSDDSSEQAIACYAHAMNHIVAMSDDPNFQWFDRVILDLHFDACSFQKLASPGRWRTGSVYITASDGSVKFTAPEAAAVPPLMSEIVEWLRNGDLEQHVIVRAAMAHLHVVSVHPFRDGNGRVSRLVQSLVLAREGLLSPEFCSIESFLASNTIEYYNQLHLVQSPSYDPSIDARSWIEFCIDAHIETAKLRIELIERASKRWSKIETIVEERGWPDRYAIALEQSFHEGSDRKRLMAESGVALPTANADFKRLVDSGLLDQEKSGRNVTYFASAALRALLGE